MKKKSILIVIILVIVFIIMYLFSVKIYKYTEDYSPSVTYIIKINKITKVLNGSFYHSCSAVDCDGSLYKYSIKLTKDEYEKIIKLWNNKKVLSPILESLCEDNKVFYKSFEESYETNIEDYNKKDLNSDGKITSREYANAWLNVVINEQKKKNTKIS